MGPFGPEMLSTRTQRRSDVGMILGRNLIQSYTVILGPPNVQL